VSLRARTHVIRTHPGVLLRCGDRSWRLHDPDDEALTIETLQSLTGGDWRAGTATRGRMRDMLLIVDEIDRAGFLVAAGADDTWELPGEARPPSAGAMATARLAVVGGRVAARAADALSERGVGHVLHAEDGVDQTALRAVDLLVACPDGPDLDWLEEIQRHAFSAAVPWLPGFVLGDEAVIGPVVRPGAPPCLRCWVLRWVGMAVSITTERAYLEHVRGGGWRAEASLPEPVAAWLGRRAAWMALRWLEHRDEPPDVEISHLRRGETARHRLIGHPACPFCAADFVEPGPAPDAWRPVPIGHVHEAAPSDVLQLLVPFESDRVGVVSRMDTPDPLDKGPAPMTVGLARFAVPHPDLVVTDTDNATYGAAADQPTARLIALVEGFERYCGLARPRPAVTAPYADVTCDAVCPVELPLYSARQYAEPGFPRLPYHADRPLGWCWGYSVTNARPRLVPQAVVRFGAADDDLVDESSSGVAAHRSRPAALLSGLLELIERDAFMITWLNRLSPPLLDVAGLTSSFAVAAIDEVRRAGYEPVVADITTDLGVPVALALATRADDASPALHIGAGSALTQTAAVDKALRELVGGVRTSQGRPWTPRPPMDPKEVVKLRDHALAYAHPSWLARARFLWSSPDRACPDRTEASSTDAWSDLARCVDRLAAHGLELIAVDLTTPDLVGVIHVVRALVPGLQPIGFGPHGIRLGGTRLYKAPWRMGHRPAPTSEGELNHDPHCFP